MKLGTHSRKGFTLIELLVVVSIISLLSSMTLSAVGSVRAKSRDSYRIQSLTSIKNALFLYGSDHSGAFPSGTYFTSHYNTGDGFDWNILKTALAPYIPTLPMDQLGSTYYWWMYTSFFIADHISGGLTDPAASGSCYGKTLIMIRSSETSLNRKECQFGAALNAMYPNAIIILLN